MARIPVEGVSDIDKQRFYDKLTKEGVSASAKIREWISDYLSLEDKNREIA